MTRGVLLLPLAAGMLGVGGLLTPGCGPPRAPAVINSEQSAGQKLSTYEPGVLTERAFLLDWPDLQRRTLPGYWGIVQVNTWRSGASVIREYDIGPYGPGWTRQVVGGHGAATISRRVEGAVLWRVTFRDGVLSAVHKEPYP